MAGSNPFPSPVNATPAPSPDPDGSALPWRGPGEDRPDLPLPPGRLPLFHRGQLRKNWRYVGFYGEDVMLCAAVVQLGIFNHTFWSVWDRGAGEGEGRTFEHTRLRPGGPEVVLDGSRVEIRTAGVRANLFFGESEPIEVISPSGRGWGWTRKRAGVPVTGTIEAGGRSFDVDGFGVDDQSAGFHARHTAWFWTAGIGVAADGRALAWNLTEGINDSPSRSERAVWVDGEPYEPAPVGFVGLEAVRFAGETGEPGLRFESGGAERRRKDNFGLIRSRYTHRFGTFTGHLDGIELASAAGVMEEHDVFW